MTYTVSSVTLNSAIPYTIQHCSQEMYSDRCFCENSTFETWRTFEQNSLTSMPSTTPMHLQLNSSGQRMNCLMQLMVCTLPCLPVIILSRNILLVTAYAHIVERGSVCMYFLLHAITLKWFEFRYLILMMTWRHPDVAMTLNRESRRSRSQYLSLLWYCCLGVRRDIWPVKKPLLEHSPVSRWDTILNLTLFWLCGIVGMILHHFPAFSPCFPHLETSMSPLDYALHPHIPALQCAQNVTPHLYNTDYYITKLNKSTSSVYSSTL